MVLKQARLRTDRIEPNDNKTVSIGTMKAVEFVFDELRLGGYLDELKRCGHRSLPSSRVRWPTS